MPIRAVSCFGRHLRRTQAVLQPPRRDRYTELYSQEAHPGRGKAPAARSIALNELSGENFCCCLCLLSARHRFDRWPVMRSATRSQSAGDVDRRTPNHPLLLTRAPVSLPANNPIPQAMRIDLQRVAHALKRERPIFPIVENPELSFPEFLASARMTRFEITLETSHRVDKDAGHQPHDRLDRSRAAPRRVKLCGQNGVGEVRKLIACPAYRIDSRT